MAEIANALPIIQIKVSLTAMPSRKPAPADSRESRGNAAGSYIAGLALALAGAIVLAGWLFDIPFLQSIRPGWASMKANTALGLVLSGTALWQLRHPASAGWRIRMAQACASAAALIALLTLTEYVAGLSLGIDNLLFVNWLSTIETSNPDRMAPNSASALLFGNAALLLLGGATDRSARLVAAGSFAIVTLLLGLFGVMGYAGSIFFAYSVGNLASMSLHGALAFVLFGAAAFSLTWISGGWRWSLGTSGVGLLAFSMLVVLGLSLESFRSTQQFVDMTRLVHHTQEVRTALSELNAGLAISMNGERGFVITGRENFVDPDTLWKQDSLAERHLRELTADSPQHQRQLVQLAALLRQKQDFFRKVIEERRAVGTERAASLIDTGRGQALVDAIYTITRQMDNEQRVLLGQREAQSTLSMKRTFLILPIGALLALGLFLSALLFLNAQVTERRRIAAATAASEARFRSLVLATSQFVWTTDPDGEVSTPLPSWQAYTGQSDEEVMGAGWMHALHPDDVERAVDGWERAVEARSLYEVEYRLRRHDGIYRDVSVRATGVLNSDDSVREWIGTCIDVTDRRKAEAERDRFFSLSLDLMCVANMDGHFLRVNAAFETTLGFDESELLGRPFLDFVHPEDQAPALEVMKSLGTGAKLVNFENRYLCKDGSYRWLNWTCAPVVEDGQLYAVAHDITERK
ncbi:MAG: PAS domain S-box protein, partial [Dokdonella sp.]